MSRETPDIRPLLVQDLVNQGISPEMADELLDQAQHWGALIHLKEVARACEGG